MDVAPAHRSRRSFPNLQHLSLAPLSSRFPIDDDGYDQEYQDIHVPRQSYIQGKSAPTTPSILSRSPSRKRKGKKQAPLHDSYFPHSLDSSNLPITKTKSTSALLAHGQGHHRRQYSGALSPTTARRSQRTSQSNDEWLYRAGLAIASEMRESKGQSWLVSRDSSTSLVDQSGEYTLEHHRVALMSGEHFADDEDSPVTPRYSRNPSVAVSRGASARNSRRGSRAGSRMDFMMPLDGRTPSALAAEGDYFDDVDVAAEPDFVENEDDGAVDDEEVSRLAKLKGAGIGGLVDKLVGFSLFNVDEDGEDTEDENVDETAEEAIQRKQADMKRRREQLERAANSSAFATTARAETIEPPKQGQEGSWQDAAWLLSVASKVLY